MLNHNGLAAPSITVGVMGAAGGLIPKDVRAKAHELGVEIARRKYVLITGACPGLPQEAVRGAKEMGGFVVGISPGLNFQEHIQKYRSPWFGYDAIIYTGSGLMGREIENIRSCDFIIFAGGRSGTLGEFAIAYDEGRIIGVLRGTGGITDHLDTIISFTAKETGADVAYDSDPKALLDKLSSIYHQRTLPLYLELLRDSNPDGELNP